MTSIPAVRGHRGGPARGPTRMTIGPDRVPEDQNNQRGMSGPITRHRLWTAYTLPKASMAHRTPSQRPTRQTSLGDASRAGEVWRKLADPSRSLSTHRQTPPIWTRVKPQDTRRVWNRLPSSLSRRRVSCLDEGELTATVGACNRLEVTG
jgi:hypothetical protein